MKKRISSLLLIIMLLINCLPLQGVAAIGTPQYILDSETVQVGDTFTMDISIADNPGIISLRFKVVYDTEVLELQSVANSGVLNGFTTPAPTITSPYTLRWADSLATTDNTVQGTVITLTFMALQVTNSTSVTIEHGEARNAMGTKVAFSNATADITVREIPVDVTGVEINKESLSLKTGESETLIATVSPDNATNKVVTWNSDDDTIATVDNNGKVTAVKKGTTTITVTTEDGSFSDTCEVSVACSHTNQTPVAEKTSDCKNQGWDAYAKCDDCGQLLTENGTTEINEIPFRPLSEQHTGGTATCTGMAVCTVCGNPYGNLASHSYTSTEKKAEALKTEGNCRDNAVYWYSCSACGNVESDDNHTFLGDNVADTHVGGTALVNQAEANHKTQTDGYTGDPQCLGCGEIVAYGQTIPADEHTPANIWSNDSEYHWKECTVVGCGIVINGSKAPHSSDKAENKATCQKKAVCDVCGVSYTCKQPEINTIMLYNLDAPVAGETPDTAVTAAYPELYEVTNVQWLDEEDGVVQSFEQGRLYTAEITVAAKDYNGVDGCIFANSVTAYIDGAEVTGWDNSVTVNNDNTLTVRYGFRKGAFAPEVGYSISGTVTSFNDAEGDVTLQLFYGSSPAPSYETTVKGNTVDYGFSDVVSGTYTLKVSKANHVTRTYTVTVGGQSVIQDVKICLLGDVDGNGKINVGDTGKVYAHIKKNALLTDEYALACVDVNGDGKVNVGDVSRIYAHVKKDNLLW